VADGKVYATTGEVAQYGGEQGTSEFACLNAYTGEVIWKLPIEALAPRESVAVAYGRLYLIPGTVTDAVDAISGSEYTSFNQVWAIADVDSGNATVTPSPSSASSSDNSRIMTYLFVIVIVVVFAVILVFFLQRSSQRRTFRW
jgi:outer membrane protein assembly factor BamB